MKNFWKTESLIGFILKAGAPKEIRVSNIIIESALEQICEVCKTRLRRVKKLQGIDEFWMNMRRFR